MKTVLREAGRGFRIVAGALALCLAPWQFCHGRTVPWYWRSANRGTRPRRVVTPCTGRQCHSSPNGARLLAAEDYLIIYEQDSEAEPHWSGRLYCSGPSNSLRQVQLLLTRQVQPS